VLPGPKWGRGQSTPLGREGLTRRGKANWLFKEDWKDCAKKFVSKLVSRWGFIGKTTPIGRVSFLKRINGTKPVPKGDPLG